MQGGVKLITLSVYHFLLLRPRQLFAKINVSAAENDADSGDAFDVGKFFGQGDGDAYSCAWLNDELHSLPHESHGFDDCGIWDENNALHEVPNHRPRVASQRRSETVRDSVRSIALVTDEALFDVLGAVRVGSPGGLCAENTNVGLDAFSSDGDARNETPAAEGNDEGVEIGNLREKLERDSALP